LRGDQVRVYFSSRDSQKRSSIGFVELALGDPGKVLQLSESPVLAPGERGAFDDSGVSLGWIVPDRGALLLYYVGWNLGVTVPFRNSIGLARSADGERFDRVSKAPVLDRSEHDPFSLSYPCVLQDGADDWKMWYGSNVSWGPGHSDMVHVIKIARSTDGLHWNPGDGACLEASRPDESAFSRPCVLRDGDLYRMWYSFRGAVYRIGYAESTDGMHWNRSDDVAGLRPSLSGWDSESVEYPFVFRHGGTLFMVYNGNAYGRDGFGLAVLEES
jgi:predicted GH43/DUF377 family glycosyl hydrolase